MVQKIYMHFLVRQSFIKHQLNFEKKCVCHSPAVAAYCFFSSFFSFFWRGNQSAFKMDLKLAWSVCSFSKLFRLVPTSHVSSKDDGYTWAEGNHSSPTSLPSALPLLQTKIHLVPGRTIVSNFHTDIEALLLTQYLKIYSLVLFLIPDPCNDFPWLTS